MQDALRRALAAFFAGVPGRCIEALAEVVGLLTDRALVFVGGHGAPRAA